MSPVMRTRRDGSVRPARYRAVQPLAVVWLTVVWVALWGDVAAAQRRSAALLVAVLVCLVFPLPAAATGACGPAAAAALAGRCASSSTSCGPASRSPATILRAAPGRATR